MKLYLVLSKKDQNSAIESVILTDECFSWTAFLLGALWFLFYRMPIFAAIIFVASFAFGVFVEIGLFSNLEIIVIEIGFMTFMAYNAKTWRVKHLFAQKYQLETIILAQNKLEAKIKAVEELSNKYPQFNIEEISELVVDSRAYRKKLQKETPYFCV